MENDESTPTTGAPYKDTPVVAPSGKRMPLRDPNANTAGSKRSRGARQTSRGRGEQRQGDTAPYEEVAQGQRQDDLEVRRAHEAAAREEAAREAIEREAAAEAEARADITRRREDEP